MTTIDIETRAMSILEEYEEKQKQEPEPAKPTKKPLRYVKIQGEEQELQGPEPQNEEPQLTSKQTRRPNKPQTKVLEETSESDSDSL